MDSTFTKSLPLDIALKQAIDLHRAGRLQEAELLYRAVLQAQPRQADANHNFGVLAVQVKKPGAALAYLKTALEENPRQRQHWFSYIDALIQAGQVDAARQVIAQGRQSGIQGEELRKFEARMDGLESLSLDRTDEYASAIAFREAGRYKEAADGLQRYLVGNPQDAIAQALLSQVLSLDNQEEFAWVALNKALAIEPTLPMVQRNHARLLLKQQKIAEALLTARAAYQGDANDAETRLVLAAVLAANGQTDQALPLVEGVLLSCPNYAEAFASRALLKLRSNDYAGALVDVEKCLTIKPHLVQMWGIAASLRHKFEDMPGAIEALERALNYEPDHSVHLTNLGEFKRQAGEINAAIVLLEKAVAVAPENASTWVNLGTALQESNRIPEAKAAYAKALAIVPEQAAVANNLGVLAKGEASWEEALCFFNQAVQIKPDFAEAHNNLGGTFKELGRLEDAEASYRRALEIKPDYAEAHNNLGNIFKQLNRLEDAEASYQRALEIKPDFAEVHNNLGITCKARGRLCEAETSYRRALEIKPHYADAHSNLGHTLAAMGRLNEAEVCFRRALQIKPDLAGTYNELGNTLSSKGNMGEAEVCYWNALEHKPNWASPYYNLHALVLKPDDMATAINYMEKSVEIDPGNMNFRFFLGMILDYSGNQKNAALHFDLVKKSTSLYQAKLDAWQYLKSEFANSKIPITGSNIQAFKIGIAAAGINGLVLEFGVRFGASIRQIAALADQEVHGFDSFEGLPDTWHHEPKGAYSTHGVIPDVPENVTLHAGWFEDTLPEFLTRHQGPVRFMNIDCDIYSSTKTVLELLAERIVSGTVIVFDEYIGNEFWREDEFKAFQEAVVRNNWTYEYLCFSFFTKQLAVRIL